MHFLEEFMCESKDFYTLVCDDGFLIGGNPKGKQWMYIWNKPRLAGEFQKDFPEYSVVGLTLRQFVETIKGQRELGLTHIWLEKGGKDDGSLMTVNQSIQYCGSIVASFDTEKKNASPRGCMLVVAAVLVPIATAVCYLYFWE